jgi:copper resistance protein B
MAAARADLAREGRFFGNALIVDRLEYRAVRGRDGYGWQGEAWIGADLDKLVIASEGEGAFGETAERIELRALWRHAIAPYFNVEAGVRHDFQPGPQRTYATFGIDGLAPYWFDVEAQLLVSDKGDVHARFEGSYDLRLTNRLILQPAVELDAAFQDVPELRTGAGFDRLEAGARLRYQITRQLAPYIGVHWERRLGETARLGALAGEGPRQSAWRSASEAGSRRQGAMTNRRKPDRTTFGCLVVGTSMLMLALMGVLNAIVVL